MAREETHYAVSDRVTTWMLSCRAGYPKYVLITQPVTVTPSL